MEQLSHTQTLIPKVMPQSCRKQLKLKVCLLTLSYMKTFSAIRAKGHRGWRKMLITEVWVQMCNFFLLQEWTRTWSLQSWWRETMSRDRRLKSLMNTKLERCVTKRYCIMHLKFLNDIDSVLLLCSALQRLDTALKSVLRSDCEDVSLALLMPPAHFDAHLLRKATKVQVCSFQATLTCTI